MHEDYTVDKATVVLIYFCNGYKSVDENRNEIILAWCAVVGDYWVDSDWKRCPDLLGARPPAVQGVVLYLSSRSHGLVPHSRHLSSLSSNKHVFLIEGESSLEVPRMSALIIVITNFLVHWELNPGSFIMRYLPKTFLNLTKSLSFSVWAWTCDPLTKCVPQHLILILDQYYEVIKMSWFYGNIQWDYSGLSYENLVENLMCYGNHCAQGKLFPSFLRNKL